MIIPEEILSHILLFSESRISFILGRVPDAKSMFLEGGPGFVLEALLHHGGDLKSLFHIKRFVPASIAICKAVNTQDPFITKRVCLLWNLWRSDYAFAMACHNRFTWAMKHIKPCRELSQHLANRVYFERGELHNINLDIEDPFKAFASLRPAIKADHITYTPYIQTLSDRELLLLYILKDMETEAFGILENRDIYDLGDILEHAMDLRACYAMVDKIFRKYGSKYQLKLRDIHRICVEHRDRDAMVYFQVPDLHLHDAVFQEDIDLINQALLHQRERMLHVLMFYEEQFAYDYEAMLQNKSLRLVDRDGNWEGGAAVGKFYFSHYDYSEEVLFREFKEAMGPQGRIKTIHYFPNAYRITAPPSRHILYFLDHHGNHVLDQLSHHRLYIVPQLIPVQMEYTQRLMTIMLERGYQIKEDAPAADKENNRLAVYLCNKTIYCTFHLLLGQNANTCDDDDDTYLHFNDGYPNIAIAKDIILAFKTYNDSQ